MKVTTLMEDYSGSRQDLVAEHGLSLYIEVDGKKILFDTGQNGKFIENAKKLNIDLKDLDYVIISHGHFDHGGGFRDLMEEINPDIKLYVGKGFFDEKYNLMEGGDYEFKGNSFDESFLQEHNIPVEYVHEKMINLTENLMLFTNFDRDEKFENINEIMYLKKDGEYSLDDYNEEVSLGIKTDKGLLVLVGCSHPGIVNILESIKNRTEMDVYGVIGGTHLIMEDDEKINKIIDYLVDEEIELVGACHCTGKHGETMLSQQLGDVFRENHPGDVLIL